MRQKLFQIAFLISLTFNLAALAAVVYGLAAKPAAGNRANAFAAYERLNLTAEQKKILGARYVDTIRRITEAQALYTAKWAEITELVAQPQPDWKAIEARQQEILDLNRVTQTMIFRRWDGVKNDLTPEQQKLFYEILRERIKSGALLGEIKTAQELLRQREAQPQH